MEVDSALVWIQFHVKNANYELHLTRWEHPKPRGCKGFCNVEEKKILHRTLIQQLSVNFEGKNSMKLQPSTIAPASKDSNRGWPASIICSLGIWTPSSTAYKGTQKAQASYDWKLSHVIEDLRKGEGWKKPALDSRLRLVRTNSENGNNKVCPMAKGS